MAFKRTAVIETPSKAVAELHPRFSSVAGGVARHGRSAAASLRGRTGR
jgi:hypothetical protein